MAIQVNPVSSPRIITVPEADGDSITVQSLVNQIRVWEHNLENLSYLKLLSAAGKEDLGGGVKVGITAKLENAKLKFADRGTPTTCLISGGNLVAVDATGGSMHPIDPSTNVTVGLAQSTSPSIIAAVAEWSQTEKDSILASMDKVETNIGSVETNVGGVSVSLDESKRKGIKLFEKDKESLEAIRARIDEVYSKPTGAKGFTV